MPMYNAQDIKRNIIETRNILNKITKDFEIIVVNDGSKNKCFEEAKKVEGGNIKVVGYTTNYGKGYAIKYGFKYTRGDYVAFVDSGRDLNPNQLKQFMHIMEKEKADVVIGSKRHQDSKVYYPPIRKLMSWTYQILNRIFFNLKIKDTQVGLKLFKRKVLEKVMPKIVIKRFAFDLELLILANKYSFKIVEAPIVLRYKFKSTINPKAVFFMLWDTLALFYRLKILRWYDK